MALLSKINFRRILVVFLVQVTLFLGLAFGAGNDNQAFAEILGRKGDDANTEKLLNDEQVEAAKEKRRETQAKRSEQASQKNADESVAEKLNLGESLPESTKKILKQVQGK